MSAIAAIILGLQFADFAFGLVGRGVTKFYKIVDVAFTGLLFSILYTGYGSLTYIGFVSLGFSIAMFIYRAKNDYRTEVGYSKMYPKSSIIRYLMPTPLTWDELEKYRKSIQIFYFVRIPRWRKENKIH